jgi:4a-hydroxytetrahydrobiopterin dehydratase
VNRLDDADITARLRAVPGWDRSGNALSRTYRFRDFREAVAFVDRVADVAERASHHPDIAIRYNVVTLTLSTHDAGGITDRDFSLATAIDT